MTSTPSTLNSCVSGLAVRYTDSEGAVYILVGECPSSADAVYDFDTLVGVCPSSADAVHDFEVKFGA